MTPERRNTALMAGGGAAVLLLVVVIVRASSCGGGPSLGGADDGGDGALAANASTSTSANEAAKGDGGDRLDEPLAPARCVAFPGEVPLADPAVPQGDVLVGDAVRAPDGTAAVGVVRTTSAGPTLGVVRVGVAPNGSPGAARFVAIGPARGDVPPPLPFVHDGRVWSAWYVESGDAGKRQRRLVLGKSDDAGTGFTEIESIPQGSDASYDVDVLDVGAAVLVAWDEDAARGGSILVARALDATGGTSAHPTIVSADAADAAPPADVDSPRLFARPGGGATVAWIARRADTGAIAPDAASPDETLEGPGERRTPQWLAVAAVDDQARRTVEPRRATSASGLVTAFDGAATAAGVDLVLRDAVESREGQGTRLVLFSQRGTSPGSASALVREGVGRGDPILVAARAGADDALAFYADPADHTRLLPLAGGRATGPASVEPALEGARVLVPLALPDAAPSALRHEDGGAVASAASGTAVLVAASRGDDQPHGPAGLKLVFCGR